MHSYEALIYDKDTSVTIQQKGKVDQFGVLLSLKWFEYSIEHVRIVTPTVPQAKYS